ncbi:fungal-specific transcription factor domain-containing protein [Talaromyces proteolyticus]|uniref:Fungal-specific transcription factor domain-containing protein n=1 Tax=Talaromyces proteolyticus TaxID=1131652 RepID=A0AAD4KDJ4_9EURO|nr:fungal-specific transcription factor domain-containing protein [Talaromyces proteolyticus]KAH8689170.1 fungal-specific transcription factor domain-containing protein [Talaromyces proteolyticus]
MFSTFSTLEFSNNKDAEPRAKRRQVLRACETCRIKRSKCDDNTPCSTCISRNWVCSRTPVSASEPKSLAAALMEISALKEKIRTLEESQSQASVVTPPSSNLDSPSSQYAIIEWNDIIENRRFAWPKTPVHHVQNNECDYFGTLSTERFITRIINHWNSYPQKSPLWDFLNLKSIPIKCRQPRDLSELSALGGGSGNILESEVISKAQQYQYIRQFWHLHHPSLPIICERDFTAHFESLWIPDSAEPVQRSRAPSSLADIMIAICALAKASASKQILGQSSLGNSPSGHSLRETTDYAISVWHYRRCQRLIDDELDMPTTFTVQAQILMAIYLHSTSRLSAAYNVLGTAVRIAYSLGLHRDPPESPTPDCLTITKAELCRRIWWSLYIIDSRISMELGRPMLVDLDISDCRLPADDMNTSRNAALQPYTSPTGVTWLSYIVQAAKLCTIVRSISSNLYEESYNTGGIPSKLGNHDSQMPSDEISTAERLEKKLKNLGEWVRGLPHSLQLPRTGNEPALSSEISSLQLDLYAPPWMQNQKIFLELDYHNAIVTLIRPIVTVGQPQGEKSEALEKLINKLTDHAVTIIRICHQFSLETDILADHPELSSVVWSAALTLLYRLTTHSAGVEENKKLTQTLSLVSEILENVDSIDPVALAAMIRVRRLHRQVNEWTPGATHSQLDLQVNQAGQSLPPGIDIDSLMMAPSASMVREAFSTADLCVEDWDPEFLLSVPKPN